MKCTERSINKNNGSVIKWLRLVVLLAFFPVIAFSADPPGIPDGWSDGYVYDNGIRVHYYHALPAPEKPVMVMVHGVTDNGLCWTTLALELQDDYNIYMLDTRGHGLSDPFTASDDDETLIKDVVGFVKAMNIEKPILVGHSMGAATVMRLGAEYPDIAQKIIMLDPFLARPDRSQNDDTRKKPPKKNTEKTDEKQKKSSAEKSAKNLSINMFGDPETLVKQNNYAYDDLVEKGRRDHPKWDIVDVKYWALSKKQYHGPYSSDAWGVMRGTMNIGNSLSEIQAPSLVLKADTSTEGRKANEEAVDGMDRVKLIHIEGTGHNLHHDDLEQTVKEMKKFLSGS